MIFYSVLCFNPLAHGDLHAFCSILILNLMLKWMMLCQMVHLFEFWLQERRMVTRGRHAFMWGKWVLPCHWTLSSWFYNSDLTKYLEILNFILYCLFFCLSTVYGGPQSIDILKDCKCCYHGSWQSLIFPETILPRTHYKQPKVTKFFCLYSSVDDTNRVALKIVWFMTTCKLWGNFLILSLQAQKIFGNRWTEIAKVVSGR